MTGLLKDLMHARADSLGPPDLDLSVITRAAERRVRRRRTAWAGGVAAAAVVTALVGATLLPGSDPEGRRHVVADGTDAAPVSLSWITGDTLHRAGRPDVDLGGAVRAWVWAGSSIVHVDTERRVLVWSGDALDLVGRAAPSDPDDSELVADGTRAGWVDVDDGYIVVDTATGERSALADVGRQPRITALDGQVVYAVDGRGVFSWNTATDAVEVLDEDPAHVVLDAEDGTLVQHRGNRSARVSGPGRDLTLTVDSVANLSPGGAFVMAESDDEGVLLDTTTGEEIRLTTGHEWALPYQWLDDDTVAVLAFDGINRAEGGPRAFLQTCEMATGECAHPGTEVPSESGSFQLPIGVHFSE